MSDTTLQPVFQIDYLGHTELHDVYHVVIYPPLASSVEAQAQYKQRVLQGIAQARSHGRNIWVAVDLSHITTPQLVQVAYRVGLPFMREPLTIKVYGIEGIVIKDAATKSLDWLMRHTFKIEFVADRMAALPPGFVIEGEATA
ncbi:MAG TPA: hypothetical protein VFZ66_02295 [Herpetosiphonaceae bacterium]